MATMATNLATVNDGQLIQDNSTRNAITALKAVLTNSVAATVPSVIASTTAGGVAAVLETLINNLRASGLVT